MKSHPAEARAHGLSAAKVDEWLRADKGKPWERAAGGLVGYDAGGGVDPTQASGIGGITPSATTANPLMQGVMQRYASLPTEKLQELAGAMGGSPQGQIIRSLLQKRLTQPNAAQPAAQGQSGQAPQQQTITPAGMMQPQQPQAQRRGGVTRRDIGGGISLSEADPSWTRQQARGEVAGSSGVLPGGSFGRADTIQTTAPGGAYVLPADVVSALGEGNTLAGARVVDEMLRSGPHGATMPRGGGRDTIPRPPSPASSMAARGGMLRPGGVAPGRGSAPVMLSDGEYVIHPEDVAGIGRGDIKLGHRILDAFVEHVRAEHIKKLRKLPGPVKP